MIEARASIIELWIDPKHVPSKECYDHNSRREPRASNKIVEDAQLSPHLYGTFTPIGPTVPVRQQPRSTAMLLVTIFETGEYYRFRDLAEVVRTLRTTYGSLNPSLCRVTFDTLFYGDKEIGSIQNIEEIPTDPGHF